uniref:Single domain-containing protein n=1 Tax=Homalodisca liturata TaxID=320908 RepID=A0A1B6HQQ4_9HEMI
MFGHLTIAVIFIGGGVAVAIPNPEETCVTNGHIYEKGDKWQPLGECAEATCTGNNDYSKLGCPKIAVDKKAGWTLSKEDPSQSYPACCPQPVPPKNGNKKSS